MSSAPMPWDKLVGQTWWQIMMADCAHHWVAAPDGPTSSGVCRNCKAIKEFANHSPIDQIYGKQPGGLPHYLTNRVNDQIEGDIRLAQAVNDYYTRRY